MSSNAFPEVFRDSWAWRSASNFPLFIFLHNYRGSYLTCNILQSAKEISSRTNHVFISSVALCSYLRSSAERGSPRSAQPASACPCPLPSLPPLARPYPHISHDVTAGPDYSKRSSSRAFLATGGRSARVRVAGCDVRSWGGSCHVQRAAGRPAGPPRDSASLP